MKTPANEDRFLKSIGGDLRLLGMVLAILGTLVCLVASSQGVRNLDAKAFAVAGVLILLLPGVWFAVAASLVRGGRGARIVTWSLRVVAVQVAACAFAVLFAWLGTRSSRTMPVVVPLLFVGVFAPAQAALVWQLIRAQHLIDARDARRGFAAGDARVAEVVALPADLDVSAIPIAQQRDPTTHRTS